MKYLILGLALSGVAYGQEPVGYVPEPLLMRSEALGQMFRSSPMLQKFSLGMVGDWRLNVARTYANFWGHDTGYIVDTEMKDDQITFYYQPLETMEFYGSFSDRAFSRLGTDGMAIGFHSFFGLPQDGRLQAPRENTRFSVPDYNLNYSTAQKNAVVSRQFEGGLVWDFARAYALKHPMTLAVYATHETAKSNPYFTGATDIGARLSMALPFETWSLYGSLSFVAFDGTEEDSLSTYHQQWGGVAGGAYRVAPNHEVISQFMVFQPLFQRMGQLSRNSYEVHLAYRYKWDEVSFELGLIENIFWVYNSPDWGVTMGLTYHSKP